MPFKKVTVIGLGLIGGSLAWALKESKQVENVYGVDTDRESVDYALGNNMIDTGSSDPEEGVSDAEIVVIAVRVGAITEVAKSIIPSLTQGTVLTDVGSVKGDIVNEVENLVPSGIHFVGGHPIAGTERSGAMAGERGLFRGRRVILTPTAKTDPGARDKVASLWKAAGSEVHELDMLAHDRIFGFISHLPHVVAYSLIDSVLNADNSEALFDFAGGGLGDYTRIAASSPDMWADIFNANKGNVLQAIGEFKGSLEKIEAAIKSGDRSSLLEILSQASEAKRETVK
ncbi:MAG: prephenate dehydrogenase/arogenate dehydrogenase family protein [Deltaproteobacteria bacterium]